ncbi:hypothetical protein FisN_14Lh071 [Fistulifera solaris]|uniref:Uncharacterized protein n=1 Tax=Fistulifera solaris TaxID=1519565 RepID=A0A1Z5J9J9_FISSO|nr:hypothetical protein FisN_14Lh071 [Fistulifera solaris]|eukprot:GAX10572.1 hypothetical protein FisN_14Lh071 [Fistulifera solaris]
MSERSSQFTPVTMRKGISPLRESPSNFNESPLQQVPPLYPLRMVDSELSHTKICGKGMIDKILGKQENSRQVVLPFGGYHPFDGVEVPDSPITVYSSYDGKGAAGDATPETPTDENALQFSPAQIRLSADKHGVEAQHTPIRSNGSIKSSEDHGSYSTPSSRKTNKSGGSAKSKSSEKRRISSLFRRKPPTPYPKSGPLPVVVEVPSNDSSDSQPENNHLELKSSSDVAPSTASTHPVNSSGSSISSETDAVLQAMRDLVLRQQEALQALAAEKAMYAKELELQRASVTTLQTVNQEQSEKINLLASTNQQVQSESEWLREQIQAIRQEVMSLHKSSSQQDSHDEHQHPSSRHGDTAADKVSVTLSGDSREARESGDFDNTKPDIPLKDKFSYSTDSDSMSTFPMWTNVEGNTDLYHREKMSKTTSNQQLSMQSAASTTGTNLIEARSAWDDGEQMFASISGQSQLINLNAASTQSFDVFPSNNGHTTILTPNWKNEDTKKLKPALRGTKITVSTVEPSSHRSVTFNSPLSETNVFPRFCDENVGDKSSSSKTSSREEIGAYRNRLEALQERREQRKTRQTTIRWDEKFLKESREDQHRFGYC